MQYIRVSGKKQIRVIVFRGKRFFAYSGKTRSENLRSDKNRSTAWLCPVCCQATFKLLRIRITKGFKGPFVIYAPILMFEWGQCYTRHFVLFIMDPIQIIMNIYVTNRLFFRIMSSFKSVALLPVGHHRKSIVFSTNCKSRPHITIFRFHLLKLTN